MQFLEKIPYILLALLALVIMIIVHELGHYSIGKLFKFKIKEFAIGFGKPLYKKTKKSGEVFSIRMLPLGGFCAFEGEDEDNSDKDAFNNKPCYQRLLVLLAGVTFNFIFAVIVMTIFFSVWGFTLPQVNTAYTSDDVEQLLQEGDIILEIDGKMVYAFDVASKLSGKDSVSLLIDRNGEKIELLVSKGYFNYIKDDGSIEKSYGLGILSQSVYYKYNFGNSLLRGFLYPFKLAAMTFSVIGQIFTGALGVKGSIGGPLTTIGVMTSAVQQLGFAAFINLLGVMSASLALMNILPIPALDGSRAIFVIIEWIRGKPVKREVEGYIHAVGLIVLFSLTILLDIINLL